MRLRDVMMALLEASIFLAALAALSAAVVVFAAI